MEFGVPDSDVAAAPATGGTPREAVIAYRVPELWADVNVVGSPDVERLRNTLRSQHEDKVPRRGR